MSYQEGRNESFTRIKRYIVISFSFENNFLDIAQIVSPIQTWCIVTNIDQQTLIHLFFSVFSIYFITTGKILVFYILFYLALSGFFIGLLAIFWTTLDYHMPKWQLAESIIGTNPGLGFRPMPPEAHLGSTLIWYKSNRPDNMRYWLDTVNKFFDGNSN